MMRDVVVNASSKSGCEEPVVCSSSSADTRLAASNITDLAAGATPPFTKLRGEENWVDWKMLMELHLGELFVCTLRDPPPEAMENRESAEFKRDLQARTRILFAMEERLLKHVRGATTAHQVWTRLCQVFHARIHSRRVALLKKLIGLRQRTTVDAYVAEFSDTLNRVSEAGIQIDDMLASIMLLGGTKTELRGLVETVERTCVVQRADGALTLPYPEVSAVLLRDAPASSAPPDPSPSPRRSRDAVQRDEEAAGRSRPSDPRLKKHPTPDLELPKVRVKKEMIKKEVGEEVCPSIIIEETLPLPPIMVEETLTLPSKRRDEETSAPMPEKSTSADPCEGREAVSPRKKKSHLPSKEAADSAWDDTSYPTRNEEDYPPQKRMRSSQDYHPSSYKRPLFPKCGYCRRTNHPEEKCHFKNKYSKGNHFSGNTRGKGWKKWHLPGDRDR